MKILGCSDGSEAAERAIRLSAVIAAGCQAQVTLLGITEVAGTAEPLIESLRRGQKLFEEKQIAAELVTKAGEPMTEIIERTADIQYDLVVIGAARREPHRAFWRSSKSYKIIKRVRPPVLLVASDVTSIKRILICTGGKKYIDNAVTLTGQIARGMGAGATLLHVMPPLPAIYARLYREEVDVAAVLNSHSELGLNLRNEKSVLESLGVPTEVRLRQGIVLDEIFDEIREGGYDLVVSGSSFSRGSLHTSVLGDVTREIVNRTEGAVLVVRAAGKPESLLGSVRDLFDRVTHGHSKDVPGPGDTSSK